MSTIVLYTSKRGSTKKYAQWIAEELNCEALPYDKDKLSMIKDYDTVIYGGWVRAGAIMGLDKIRKNFKYFDGKKLIVFSVGLSLDNKENYLQLREINFKAPLNLTPLFVCLGAFDPEKVKGGEKLIIGIIKKAVGSGKSQDEDQEAVIKSLTEGADLMDKDKILPIIDMAMGE